jgi:hypothetical protein
MADHEQKVSELAYSIWEKEGRPDGQSGRHWRMAEKAIEKLNLVDATVAMNKERPLTAPDAAAVEAPRMSNASHAKSTHTERSSFFDRLVALFR